MELAAPMRASCTAAAITGPATTWVATSAPLMSSDTPPASTSRNGAGGFSVWRARVASISRRESAAGLAPLGRSETGLMVVGMGSSCRGIGRAIRKVSSVAVPFARRGVHSPPWVSSADLWPRFGGAPSSRAIGSGTISSLPILLNLALGIAALFLAGRYWHDEAFVGEQLIKAPAVGWLILVVLTIVSGVVLFLVAQPLLSAVFSDRLSERVERQLRGSAPTAPFLASTGRALAHGLLKLVLYALAC